MAASVIKQLAAASYTNGELDATKVNKISEKLSRTVLKQYIRELKKIEKQHTVYVESASALDNAARKSVETLYADKKIVYNTDPKLMLGVRLTDNDTIYEMNLDNTLKSIADYIEETYD